MRNRRRDIRQVSTLRISPDPVPSTFTYSFVMNSEEIIGLLLFGAFAEAGILAFASFVLWRLASCIARSDWLNQQDLATCRDASHVRRAD